MPDREKVIEALECADMTDGVIKMSNQFRDIVVELLKEQEAVVHCRDCKHSKHWYGDKCRCFLWHETGIDVFNDGFCNYGERKEGR